MTTHCCLIVRLPKGESGICLIYSQVSRTFGIVYACVWLEVGDNGQGVEIHGEEEEERGKERGYWQ